MGRIEQIAAGLTKGERNALLAAIDADGVWRVPTYAGRKRNGNLLRVSRLTLDSLTRKWLTRSYPPDLLPDGLAVRTHILTEEQQP